jgi:6-phosphogluconolactonase (cycloisomerase 2 family)
MKSLRFLLLLALCALWASMAEAGGPPSKPAVASYLITNNDLAVKVAATSGTFFPIASDGTLQNPTHVTLGGAGAGGGYFAAGRVSVLQSSTAACAYLSIGGAAEIGAVDINALQDIGNFSGAATDSGIDNGIGLVNNGTYVYASFSTSNTIGAFAVLPGCALNFLGDVSPIGKHLGNVKGMAVHGNVLVLAYGDGSIESFNVSAGIPVSNGDLQNATGYTKDLYPIAVDITQDGHYAIFGDMASTTTTVEVSDISSGKLTKTVLYNVGTAANSNSIFLSPDETLLYVASTGSGKVSAAFFDQTTGKVSPGCTSATLKGFDNKWTWLNNPVTELNSGTGSVLYLAEYGASSGMAVVNVSSSGGKCTLTESTNSPVVDPDSTFLLSIGVYPPRQF